MPSCSGCTGRRHDPNDETGNRFVFDPGQTALRRRGLSLIVEDIRRTSRLRLNLTSTKRKANAPAPAARLVALLLAVLVAFSLSTFGGGHAHATGGEAHVAIGNPDVAAAGPHGHQGHAHAVPCDDSGADQGDADDCCMSATSCAVCVPVPSAGLTLATQAAPAALVPPSTSLPRDPSTLSRPPKLSVTA